MAQNLPFQVDIKENTGNSVVIGVFDIKMKDIGIIDVRFVTHTSNVV